MNSGGGVDTWTIVSGSIPPGMQMPSVYAAGATIVGGTPTQLGTFTFTVDNAPFNQPGAPPSQGTYSITVVAQLPPPLQIESCGGSGALPDGTVGTSYNQKVCVFGGVQPYTFAVIGGQLPPGLKLTPPDGPGLANDHITGTPTTAGTFVFTMQVTDAKGSTSAMQFSLTVQPGSAPPPSPPSGGGGGGQQ